MPRSVRLDAPGVVRHVIIRGIERGKIFKDSQPGDSLACCFQDLANKFRMIANTLLKRSFD